jgi:CRISPR-associated protein (TIGR02584 family)
MKPARSTWRKTASPTGPSRQRPVTDHQSPSTVLFAVTGMSPGVITETVWALAHEKPAVIPDRVVAVTTKAGREAIQRELFTPTPKSFGPVAAVYDRRDTVAAVCDRRSARPSSGAHGAPLQPGQCDRRESSPQETASTEPRYCVWDALLEALQKRRIAIKGKLRFGTTADDIRVFTRADARGRSVELEDIRTPADNEAAADFLLDALRPFTENEDVRLVCSLAGGRKTMGALLYACLSLIGREDDRLTHVLVNEPFDDPRLQPRFYFPTDDAHRAPLQSLGPVAAVCDRRDTVAAVYDHRPVDPSSDAHRAPLQSGDARRAPLEFRGTSARIELADVPFVPLRKLFPRELGRMPGSFMNLVRQYRVIVDQLAAPPQVELAEDEPVVRIDGCPIRLPATAFALFSFLVDRARRGELAFPSFKEAVDPFREFVEQWAAGRYDFRRDALEKLGAIDDATLRKLGNAIGSALKEAGLPDPVIAHLRPRRGYFGIRIKL